MKKLFLIPVLLMGVLFTGNSVKAQVQDDIYAKEHVPNRKPVPYRNVFGDLSTFAKKSILTYTIRLKKSAWSV